MTPNEKTTFPEELATRIYVLFSEFLGAEPLIFITFLAKTIITFGGRLFVFRLIFC